MIASKKRSKRRLGSNYTEKKRHEPLTFFLDRALGKRFIVQALSKRNPEITVKLLDDYFEANVADEEWLRFVGQKGWLAITKDKRIRYRTPALDVIKKEKVKLFIFTRGNLTGQEMAEILTKAIPRIKRFLAKHEPPFIVTMTKSGELSKVK
jgi:PIN like domain